VRAKSTSRQASPRALAIGGGIAALAIVVVVLVIVLTGGGSSVGPLPTQGSLVNALPGATDVRSLLKGIPQNGLVLGSPAAPVTMVEYIDLQCPFCQRFETQAAPSLINRFVRTGKVKIEARPLAFIGPDSIRGRNAMIAAGLQAKAFNFAQLLYDNQQTENTGWLDDRMLAAAAKSIPGLNPKLLFSVRNSSGVKAQATLIDSKAQADGINATPTIFVGKSGAKPKLVKLSSPTDGAAVANAIQAALSS
jgi:protein-disulfide isomerase